MIRVYKEERGRRATDRSRNARVCVWRPATDLVGLRRVLERHRPREGRRGQDRTFHLMGPSTHEWIDRVMSVCGASLVLAGLRPRGPDVADRSIRVVGKPSMPMMLVLRTWGVTDCLQGHPIRERRISLGAASRWPMCSVGYRTTVGTPWPGPGPSTKVRPISPRFSHAIESGPSMVWPPSRARLRRGIWPQDGEGPLTTR